MVLIFTKTHNIYVHNERFVVQCEHRNEGSTTNFLSITFSWCASSSKIQIQAISNSQVPHKHALKIPIQ